MGWLHIMEYATYVSGTLIGFKLLNESRNSYWLAKKTKLEVKKLEREEREAELQKRREENRRSVR
ncbi:hypothetical protein COK07_24680 [Bacillus thuringiensis]|uniref:hypothetical protein n=1 Tax=Bacillus cereus group TaxID=86661 RepID=UPI000BEDB215|nr:MULTISPECIES: hypothetical protein [Bacillus cereus group]PEF05044.1 hypothetical protein COM97_18590 [Bacillus thuringiensis]PFP73049.1 hypothetical protein COK07_24680 [Bacillus thuringiensis]PGE40409.1 hypothetical protein COM63_31320 [Bacillus cereus]